MPLLRGVVPDPVMYLVHATVHEVCYLSKIRNILKFGIHLAPRILEKGWWAWPLNTHTLQHIKYSFYVKLSTSAACIGLFDTWQWVVRYSNNVITKPIPVTQNNTALTVLHFTYYVTSNTTGECEIF
jgi:hypothetical protein